MKCKHCELPVVSRPIPMVLGQTESSGVYWAHDYGNGVRSVFAFAGFGSRQHTAEPRSTLRKCKHCGRDMVRKLTQSRYGELGMFWTHVQSDLTFCNNDLDSDNWNRAEPCEPAGYPLWIKLRTWERQDCASVEIRDYLRGVWQSAGHATGVEL